MLSMRPNGMQAYVRRRVVSLRVCTLKVNETRRLLEKRERAVCTILKLFTIDYLPLRGASFSQRYTFQFRCPKTIHSLASILLRSWSATSAYSSCCLQTSANFCEKLTHNLLLPFYVPFGRQTTLPACHLWYFVIPTAIVTQIFPEHGCFRLKSFLSPHTILPHRVAWLSPEVRMPSPLLIAIRVDRI